MTAFAKLHPVTKVAFFVAAFVLTLAAGNPVFSAISLCTALLCMTQSGGRAFFNSTVFSLIIVAVAGLFNMLFAHYGNTVLFTVGDTDFLLEPLFYGLNQGVVMVGVMLWFRVLSYVQDSAETAYLFRFAPRTALLFSMVLGFLPVVGVTLPFLSAGGTSVLGAMLCIGIVQSVHLYSNDERLIIKPHSNE